MTATAESRHRSNGSGTVRPIVTLMLTMRPYTVGMAGSEPVKRSIGAPSGARPASVG
jgi:hypothetical protein